MNKKRIFCDVAITGVIGMCILFLSYKFILKTANPFWESLTFMTGWMIAHLIVLVVKDKTKCCSVSKLMLINIGIAVGLIAISIAISVAFNIPDITLYVFRFSFAYAISTVLHLMMHKDEFGKPFVEEYYDDSYTDDDVFDDTF